MRSHSQELRQDPAWKILDEPNIDGLSGSPCLAFDRGSSDTFLEPAVRLQDIRRDVPRGGNSRQYSKFLSLIEATR